MPKADHTALRRVFDHVNGNGWVDAVRQAPDDVDGITLVANQAPARMLEQRAVPDARIDAEQRAGGRVLRPARLVRRQCVEEVEDDAANHQSIIMDSSARGFI